MLDNQINETIKNYPDALRIAWCGASNPAGEVEARKWISQIIAHLNGSNILMITGGTKDGIPGMVIDESRKASIPVIGILPVRGLKYIHPNLNGHIVVPPIYGRSEWGDESPVLVKLAHVIIVIGGGWGTVIEMASAFKANISRIRNGETPIKVVPIILGKEPADFQSSFLEYDLARISLPPIKITSPYRVAEYIVSLTSTVQR